MKKRMMRNGGKNAGWSGSKVVSRERETKSKRGGGKRSVNSYFLIKQQCSQLIHLICQLEEKHGRNLFT